MHLRLSALAALLAVLAFAPAAGAAPAPFGHACQPSAGTLFCPGADDAARVPSFERRDARGRRLAARDRGRAHDRHAPRLRRLETNFQDPARQPTYNAPYLARHGYAVVLPTARGFGRSCGTPDSRAPGCERGWIHVDDQRYEIRDVQWLLATLVDEDVARAGALGVTGISYGGGASLMLAFLLVDRAVVRPRSRRDGRLRPQRQRLPLPGRSPDEARAPRNAPTYRPADGEFSATVRNLRVSLPSVRDSAAARPSRPRAPQG